MHDLSVIAEILGRTGTAASLNSPMRRGLEQCFLMAHWGDDPAGIAGLETEVDAALMRPLFVLETMRRRGVGASLVQAVRVAASARGARILYAIAPATGVDYLMRFGFAEAGFAELVKMFSQASMPRRTRPEGGSECGVVRLDISRDGLIER
ncbi:MAG: GNAT family N-acetyltransferase [Deltaproteobacteria bacterium]|nr:GNAT family N-acetyltransferase [Deltaproteobacteria bacterium]